METHKTDLYKSILIGVGLAATTSVLGSYLLGSISDAEATASLQEIRSTLRFTASGSMTATATILALMLTLLSFSNSTDSKMQGWHYERIRWIARLATGTFIAALVLLMILNIPVNNAEETFQNRYRYVYYGIMAYASLIGGAMITIILLLYQAASDIILVMHPRTDADYLFISEDEEEENQSSEEAQRERAEKKIGEG